MALLSAAAPPSLTQLASSGGSSSGANGEVLWETQELFCESKRLEGETTLDYNVVFCLYHTWHCTLKGK